MLVLFPPSDDDDDDLGFQYSNWGIKKILNDNFAYSDRIMTKFA